jgi:hypothetical protein
MKTQGNERQRRSGGDDETRPSSNASQPSDSEVQDSIFDSMIMTPETYSLPLVIMLLNVLSEAGWCPWIGYAKNLPTASLLTIK